jgi:hypothetical protein
VESRIILDESKPYSPLFTPADRDAARAKLRWREDRVASLADARAAVGRQ